MKGWKGWMLLQGSGGPKCRRDLTSCTAYVGKPTPMMTCALLSIVTEAVAALVPICLHDIGAVKMFI